MSVYCTRSRRRSASISPPPPIAVQRSRRAGYRLPPNTKCVTRPGPFGNPFYVSEYPDRERLEFWCATAEEAVFKFESLVLHDERLCTIIRRELRGFNLACYCPLNAPCHRSVLLRIANET